MSQNGLGNVAMCCLYLFLCLFIISIDTFPQFIMKFSGSSASLYVLSFGSISLISLYSILASSECSRKSEVFRENKLDEGPPCWFYHCLYRRFRIFAKIQFFSDAIRYVIFNLSVSDFYHDDVYIICINSFVVLFRDIVSVIYEEIIT